MRAQSAVQTPLGSVALSRARGRTIWLTGLPSAGKTTIARALAERLAEAGRPVEVLDGDEARQVLTTGLGFSRADRPHDCYARRSGSAGMVSTSSAR